MRLYEPAQAVSYTKLGPTCYKYKFQKGTPIGANSREDEMWMDTLVANEMLVCVKDTNPAPVREVPQIPVKEPGLTVADILPHTKPDIVRKKGYQTNEEFEAKIAVAKSEEKMAELGKNQERILFDDQDKQDFYDFLKMQIGESEEEIIASIKAEYLEEHLVILCEKFGLDSKGEKIELITRLVDWVSLDKYRNEDKLVEEIDESEDLTIYENQEIEFEDSEIQELFKFIGTLAEKSVEEKIELMNDEYTRKPLISYLEKLELDSFGNKKVLSSRLLDWYNLVRE